MQPSVKSLVFPFFCLVALLGVASGLTVERVSLVNNRTYIDYRLGASPSNSLLECVYHLDEGEEVSRVYWEMWDGTDKSGTYEWRPVSGRFATGRLQGMVDLNRVDGSLELTNLKYDLGGMYLCGVGLTNEVTKNTAKEEVLIVDIGWKSTFGDYPQPCAYTSSYVSPTLFPKPSKIAGMFSPKLNKYYEKVSDFEWSDVIHSSGAVTYSYTNVGFKINEKTPDDIVFKLSVNIFKSNGERIPVDNYNFSQPSWHEVGCLDVREEANQEISYSPVDSATCRDGRKSMTLATVTCRDGYHAEGDVSIVKMRCNGASFTWKLEHGHTATIEDLVCVKNSGGGPASGNPSLALLSTSFLGIVVLLFKFSSS